MGVSQLLNLSSWDYAAEKRSRTAELTAGVLCVSAPELGSLFHKRKGGQPSASIVNGNYHRDNTHRRWMSRGVSMLNHSNRTMSSEPYHELQEGHKYDVEVSRESIHGKQRIPGEVNVTQEIRVDSHVVLDPKVSGTRGSVTSGTRM